MIFTGVHEMASEKINKLINQIELEEKE